MKKVLTFSAVELQRTSEELVRSAMVLHPDFPAARLLKSAIELADPDFLVELDQMLRTRHFLRVARAVRASEIRARRESEWLFPEIREAVLLLPVRIPVGAGKTVTRGDMSFADTGRYLKILENEQWEKRRDNRKIIALRMIRRAWPRSQRVRRMTLFEVDTAKARKAGLIE